MSIIDLVAFLPSILQVLMPGLDLRFLRILRLFRVFKLIYFASSTSCLTCSPSIMLIVLTLAASALYVVERDVQPEADLWMAADELWLPMTTRPGGDYLGIGTVF